MTDQQELPRAFAEITGWMNQHDAGVIAGNLAPGAHADELSAAEAQLGFSLPAELRALWSLHNGQVSEGNGFYEWFDLLSVDHSLAARETVLMLLAFAREDPASARERGLSAAELASDAWVPVVGRDSDTIAVNAMTGRVFECLHDDPPPALLAASVVCWLTAYAARVMADDYRVEEGFGDRYLERRDRQAERRQQERQAAAAERVRHLATEPIAALLAEAVRRKDDRACREVLEAAKQRSEAGGSEAIALLFRSGASPELIAATLRPMLRTLTLSPKQWRVIAKGGKRLGNAAIVGVAVQRIGGSAEPSRKPWWKLW